MPCDNFPRVDSGLDADLMDCYMNASLVSTSPRGHVVSIQDHPRQLTQHLRHVELPLSMLPHITTQRQLFAQLRHFWADNQPRVMVDLGCHAGHAGHFNMSDALYWLDAFGHHSESGGQVVGVDAFEDFVIDHLYRFDHVPPYSLMRNVSKRAYTYGLSPFDNRMKDATATAKGHITFCIDHGDRLGRYSKLDQRGIDHLCRLSRMRLGVLPESRQLLTHGQRFMVNATALYVRYAMVAAGVLPLAKATDSGPKRRGGPNPRYRVPTIRADTFWRSKLGGRRIHFIKV